MKNIGRVSASLLTCWSLLFSVRAEPAYDIIACKQCSVSAMQHMAESTANATLNKLHVFDPERGVLRAFYIIRDEVSNLNFSTQVSPDPLAVQRADEFLEARAAVEEPTLPTSLVTSAWELARFGARQIQVKEWLVEKTALRLQALRALQALQQLMPNSETEARFVVHFADRGQAYFTVRGTKQSAAQAEFVLDLDQAKDGLGNIIPDNPLDLEAEFVVSAGPSGNAEFMTRAVIRSFGLYDISFDGLNAVEETSRFYCTIMSGQTLRCVKSDVS